MKERNEALGELRKAETECSMLRVECGVIEKERDEARRIAAYQYAKHHNGEEETLQNNFFKLNGWNTTNKEPQ
jgi:hypothetical protein